jgi:DNA-binding MarR family transcriptional regulator
MPGRKRTAREPTPAQELGESIEFLRTLWSLTHELRALSKRMRSRLGLTGPQRLVIRILGSTPDLSATELAELIELHPSTLTGILRRLEERGFIARGSHPHDARRAVLRLTAAGLRMNRKNEHTVEAAVSRALGRLDRSTIGTTKRALDAVIEQLRRS